MYKLFITTFLFIFISQNSYSNSLDREAVKERLKEGYICWGMFFESQFSKLLSNEIKTTNAYGMYHNKAMDIIMKPAHKAIKHLKKHGVKSSHIEIEKVKNISINNLIEKYGSKVDLLIIDAEGYDGNIVIDLLENSNIQPIIIFEYIHVKFNIFNHLIKLLKDKKYSYFKIDENLICLPNKMKIKSNLDIHYPI